MARDIRPAARQGAAAPEAGSTATGATAARIVDLTGESQELVAFVLLRYLAQIERQTTRGSGAQQEFDRKWLLDAYAECLEAVKGERGRGGSEPKGAGSRAKRSGAAAED